MDIAAFVPIIVALIGGGAVAVYTARPRKESIIADAAEKAVLVVSSAIDRQAQDLAAVQEQLACARERIAVLEAERGVLAARVTSLRREVVRLGGDIDRIGKQVDEPNGSS